LVKLQYLCGLNFFEVGNRVQSLFLFIFLLVQLSGYGQSVVQSVSYIDEKIKAESFNRNTYGYKIFSSLALNNVKGLAWTYINFQGRVLIQTDLSDNHLFAYSKLIDYKMSGEDHFRDFPVDSMLVPAALSGTLRFTDDKEVNIEIPVEMLLSGGVIDLTGINVSLDSIAKLKARIKVEKFVYSKEQWEVFEQRSRLINYYYAYSKILDGLVEKYTVNGINRDQSSSEVFLAWHEIQRVNNYIRSHDFNEKLYLQNRDPLGFSVKYEQSERLEKRANTLFNQVLALQSKSSLSAKNKFAFLFSRLSVNYKTLSEKEQPYIASGFEEVVRIFPTKKEFKRLEQSASFYDVFSKIDTVNTLQAIYNNFLKLSIEANESEKYVFSLDLLYNAALISNKFTGVEKSNKQNQIYAQTLDGLLASYLQVSIMAYNTGSFDMADKYYEKAMEIYNLHQSNLEGESLSEDSFLNFIEQQVDLAYGYLGDHKFRDGLRLVDRANIISADYKLNYSESQIDSAYRIGYLGIYREKIDSIGNLIENTKIEQAVAALEAAASFSEEKGNYINGNGDDSLIMHAQSLFDIYFKRGKRLFSSDNPEEALFAFLDAQSINETYLGRNYPELDSLIYNATVPVILEMIKKAEFETWANRMENALSLQQQALAMQQKYEQTDNEELNEAFSTLQQKIDNRSCVNLENKLFELRRKAENRIKSKKYSEADDFLTEAFVLINSNPTCEPDAEKLEILKENYQPAFDFYHQMGAIEISYSTGNYTTSIEKYVKLEQFYQKKNLKNFGIEELDLHKFVKEKESVDLATASAEYCIRQKKYKEAFYYLNILKGLGVKPKSTKSLQSTIGSGIAKSSPYLEPVKEYTKSDKWYRYFRKAYLKY